MINVVVKTNYAFESEHLGLARPKICSQRCYDTFFPPRPIRSQLDEIRDTPASKMNEDFMHAPSGSGQDRSKRRQYAN